MPDFLPEVLAYVRLGPDDERLLRALHPKLEPHFPAIATRFYEAIAASPGARRVLSGPEQVDRLHRTLVDWMASGLRGPYDERFYEKRSRIGRRHVQIGLAQQYMFTAMNVVRCAYQAHVFDLYPAAEAPAVVAAVNKLLDVELAVMLRHYQLDSEERLVDRERRIQAERLQAMQTLSAGLAHEVRNPLNAARLQLELLERRLRRHVGEDPRLLVPTELADHEIGRLTALLNDFLAFARPPELHLEEADLVAVCEHVVELERPLASQRNVELVLASGGPVAGAVDPGKFHQIVQNLVRNSLEAAPSGGHVRVELDRRGDKAAHLRVTDDGRGIPPGVLARIYEPFYSTKESGTGMGMAIVHSLVTLHGGTIDIATGPEGTTFDVVLPWHDSSRAA